MALIKASRLPGMQRTMISVTALNKTSRIHGIRLASIGLCASSSAEVKARLPANGHRRGPFPSGPHVNSQTQGLLCCRTGSYKTHSFDHSNLFRCYSSGSTPAIAKGNELYTPSMFDDYRAAYASKTTWELIRARIIFFFCSSPLFTDNAERILSGSYRLLGRRVANWFIRRLIYDQFVAGDDVHSIKGVTRRLRDGGLGPLLALSIEDDVGSKDRSQRQAFLDSNLETLLSCIKLSRDLGDPCPMFQLKGTAIMTANLMKRISDLCGDQVDPEVLDASVSAMQGQVVNFRKLLGWEQLTPEENGEFLLALRRFQAVNQAIVSHDTLGMMDAEYTYLNPGLRLLALAMMCVTSVDKNRVFYTYQAYLKKTAGFLRTDLALAKSRGICFGAKLVRGAYIVKERTLAKKEGYEDPVQPSFQHTCDNYHRCLDMLLDQAVEDERKIRFIIASHNEDTVAHALNRMSSLDIKPDSPSVFFGQLYGMSDHVSYTLGRLGCSVYKSLPYGSIEETLPYLSRRAQENRAIFENARREKELVVKSLKDRLFLRGQR